MRLLHSIFTVGAYTMASRVLGFARDLLIATVLGAGPVADAFFVAFRLPNLFRRLIAEGAFGAAFIPHYAGILERRGEAAARAFAEETLALLLGVLVLLTLAAELAMPALILVLAPGFADEPERFDLAVQFARLTFPYLLLVTLTAVFGGILNTLYRFAAAAAAPIALNIAMIVALVWFRHAAATPGHVLALAVTVGGIGQCVLLALACARAGMPLRLTRPRLSLEVRRLWARVLPGIFGAGVIQINLLVGTMIASLLPTGAVSYLYYADRIYQLPLGVVGIAVGTALLPQLARELQQGETEAARTSQNRAVELALLVSLPAALALLAIPEPIIAVLFGRGAFQAASVVATSDALAAYAIGLPAFVLVRVLSPGFFARADTATPMRIGMLAVAANLALSLALAWPLAHVGLALATSLAAWLNAGLLYFRLWRDHGVRVDDRLRRRLPRVAAASLAMALMLVAAERLARPLLAEGELTRAATLALIVLAALGAFAFLAHVFGAARFGELARLLRRR